MKNLNFKSLTILGFVALLTLAGCGKKDAQPNSIAPTQSVSSYAMPPECREIPSRPLSGRRWDNHRQSGMREFSWGSNYRRGGRDSSRNSRRFQVGCAYGSFAACAPGVGIVCVPGNRVNNAQIAWYNYSLGQRTSNFCGYGAYNTASAYGGAGQDTLGMVCRLDNPVACAGIGSCQPVSLQTGLGICVR